MKFKLLLIALLATGLAACDSADEAAPETAPEAQVETEAPEAAAEAVEEPAAAEELEALNEAESEDMEEAAEAAPEEESIALAPTETTSRDYKFVEGAHFRAMTSSQGTSSAPDKIEVAEVFWYGCPHCYDFDPIIDDWKQDLPSDVSFVRIPVIWNPTNQLHARVMYTAEALGKLDEIHPAMFKAMHQEGNTLTQEDDIVALFERFDVTPEQFREAYNSFAVSSSVKRAENLTRRYGVRSVPVIIVNGKYATDGPEVKTFGQVLEVTDELVQRERDDS